MKNPLPSLPVPYLSQTLTDYLIAPRPPNLLPGFRILPSLTTPGTGHNTQYDTTSSVRVAGSSNFRNPTTSRWSVSTFESHVTQTRSTRQPVCREVYLYSRGKVSLYSLPQPHLTRGGPTRSRVRQGAGRRVTPRMPIKSTTISMPED